MSSIFLIPIFLIIIGVVALIYINNRHQHTRDLFGINLERSCYDLHKKDLLNNNFRKIETWMEGMPIDALSSLTVPSSAIDKLGAFLKAGVKSTLLKSISIKYNEEFIEAYAVLSNNHLHILIADSDGDLSEHFVLDNARLKTAKLDCFGKLKEQIGLYSKESFDYLPTIYRLSVQLDEGTLMVDLHDRLKYIPSSRQFLDVTSAELERIKHIVVGEKLIEQLKVNYSNMQ